MPKGENQQGKKRGPYKQPKEEDIRRHPSPKEKPPRYDVRKITKPEYDPDLDEHKYLKKPKRDDGKNSSLNLRLKRIISRHFRRISLV